MVEKFVYQAYVNVGWINIEIEFFEILLIFFFNVNIQLWFRFPILLFPKFENAFRFLKALENQQNSKNPEFV